MERAYGSCVLCGSQRPALLFQQGIGAFTDRIEA